MLDIGSNEVWFVTGSQHLYGPDTLQTVAEHATAIASALDAAPGIPVKVVVKPVLTGSDEILRLCQAADADDSCVGLITWMHTFSPAKMWIAGLEALRKPFLHLHTQFNERDPLVVHRHGLHEPQPGGPRRPRVRVHRGPAAAGADGRRRALGGPRGPGPDRCLDPRGQRTSRLGDRPDRPLRRQHARGRGHRRRQGRGPAAARVQRQHLRGRRPRGTGRGGLGRRRRPVDRGLSRRVRRRTGPVPGRRAPRRTARRRADRGRSPRVPRRRPLHRPHRHLRGPPRPQPAARPGRPAADGRWIRLRRRGRLEDGGHGPGHEGHVRGTARRRVVHGGLHLPLRAGRGR